MGINTEALDRIKRELTGVKIPSTPFVIQEYLTGGSFGQIFIGINENEQGLERKIAVKTEPVNVERAQLFLEYGFYLKLAGVHGVPKIYYFGPCQSYNVLIMELLGPSLVAMLKKIGRPFTLRCTAALGVKLFELMKEMHERDLIHRDIKPENFLLGPPGTPKACNVFLIDLGLCKQYRENGKHIPFHTGKVITGTPQFMSYNMHLGYELSRRDDLEAIIYTLIYLHKGILPWSIVTETEPMAKVIKMGEMKKEIGSKVCHGMMEFEIIFRRIRMLKFEEDPGYYEYIKNMLIIWEKTGGMAHSSDLVKSFDWDEQHRIKSIPTPRTGSNGSVPMCGSGSNSNSNSGLSRRVRSTNVVRNATQRNARGKESRDRGKKSKTKESLK